MLLISIFIALTTSHAEIVTLEEAWAQNGINEGNLCEAKIAPLLNKMKSETDTKLNTLDKHLQQILETTNSKNCAFENVPDKLEKYLDHKFDLLIQLLIEENINSKHKLNELENKIAKLETVMDPLIMDLKFHEPQRSISNLKQHDNIKYEKLAKKCDKIEQDINSKLDTIQKKMRDFKKLDHQSDVFDKKLHVLETDITQKWAKLEKLINDEENATSKFHDESKVLQLDMKNTFEETKKEKLKLCKERVAYGYSLEPMLLLDNNTFKCVLLTNDSKGVIDFEMHIAVKADAEATVLLSPIPNPKPSDTVYEIDMEGGGDVNYTHLRIKLRGVPHKFVLTPNMLSRTHYKTFTIRISEGKQLEFMENTYDGEKPIITYTNPDLRLVKYIGFSSWFEDHNSWFMYDCPAWN